MILSTLYIYIYIYIPIYIYIYIYTYTYTLIVSDDLCQMKGTWEIYLAVVVSEWGLGNDPMGMNDPMPSLANLNGDNIVLTSLDLKVLNFEMTAHHGLNPFSWFIWACPRTQNIHPSCNFSQFHTYFLMNHRKLSS